VKQMKIIHQNGYSVDELRLYRHTIYKNVIDCAKALIGAMQQFDISPEVSENVQHCEFIMQFTVDPDPNAHLDARCATAITSIWKDPCIPRVLDHSSEFYMMDSAS